ncbi:SH3 domain-containing protein [Rhizobium sp. TRM95111]|uniref:SH3 domain-containing protein n=1 Tax=Rhizobium alarense TaxID=2846851 RepID=UPI001F1D6B07|nr:SH3 domain-containing protein [Rhizobium alarense]MCF3638997.1 SH3 domain-containing protein [Rhizobium alarense]
MKREGMVRRAALAAVVLCAEAGTALAAACLVNDPTGTPLNVRAAPNGRILLTLGNGEKVEPVGERTHEGKPWLLVARGGQELGWVFARYILCPERGDPVEAAPIPPAEQR